MIFNESHDWLYDDDLHPSYREAEFIEIREPQNIWAPAARAAVMAIGWARQGT